MGVSLSIGVNDAGRNVEADGAVREVFLPSPHGHVTCLIQDFRFSSKTMRGEIEEHNVQVVVLPQSSTIWVGATNSHCLVTDVGIVGFSSFLGGLLVCRASTNRFDLAEQTNDTRAVEAKIRGYLRDMNWQDIISGSAKDTTVSLQKVVGISALMDLNRSEPVSAATILKAEFEGEQIAITLKSGIGKIVRLLVDRQFNPVNAQVDGKTVFQKGVISAPTLEQELNQR
jgi:hypothetical protein